MELIRYQLGYSLEVDHWWYVGRRNILHNLIKSYVNKSHLRILDVGCGSGYTASSLREYGQVWGIDFSEHSLKFCKENRISNICQGDACSLPFKDESFDLITVLDLLEHLKEDKKGLDEIYRCLKSGGIAIISVPAFMFLWSSFDIPSMHYRRYSRIELKSLCDRAGFMILKLSCINFYIFPLVAVYRLIVQKFFKNMELELREYPVFINELLIRLFSSEAHILKLFDVPFGISIVCVAKKK